MMTEAEIRSASEQTRARLLEAARETFSQHGFQGATVREICRRAEANVAAVNYHFGSKDSLLSEALNFDPLNDMQLANVDAAACPRIRFQLFIHEFMSMLLDEKKSSSQCRIMARELADPTPALDQIVREAIAPLHEFLGKLIVEVVGEKVSKAALSRYVNSIMGQCIFYSHSYPVLQRLHPTLRYSQAEIRAIAEHIAEFSLLALQQISNKPQGGTPC
jgi:AcrR family transcriptional regulator